MYPLFLSNSTCFHSPLSSSSLTLRSFLRTPIILSVRFISGVSLKFTSVVDWSHFSGSFSTGFVFSNVAFSAFTAGSSISLIRLSGYVNGDSSACSPIGANILLYLFLDIIVSFLPRTSIIWCPGYVFSG